MRILLLGLPLALTLHAADINFSGFWRLNEARSEIRALPLRPAPELAVDHKENTVRCEAVTPGQPARPCSFATDGREIRSKSPSWTISTKAKWEGSALLLNSIYLASSRQHTEMDRWKLSRDGRTLTIRRVVVTISGGEIESNLIYEKQP